MIARGTLLIVLGLWLLLQTLAGGLPRRLLSLAPTPDDGEEG